MPDKPIVVPFINKYFVFQIIPADRSIRTEKIVAEDYTAALAKITADNPGCEIKFLWEKIGWVAEPMPVARPVGRLVGRSILISFLFALLGALSYILHFHFEKYLYAISAALVVFALAAFLFEDIAKMFRKKKKKKSS